MGIRPASLSGPDLTSCTGTRDANGVDFWWDEEEGTDCIEEQPGCVDMETQRGNCWIGNQGPDGADPTGDPPLSFLPVCPGIDNGFKFPNINKLLELLPCASWDPADEHGPARVRLVHHTARAPISR